MPNVLVAIGLIVLANCILKRVMTWRTKRWRFIAAFGVAFPILIAMFWASYTREHLEFNNHPSVATLPTRVWDDPSLSALELERLPGSVEGDQEVCKALLASLDATSPDDALILLRIDDQRKAIAQDQIPSSFDGGIGWPVIWIGHTRFDDDSFPRNRFHIEFDPTWYMIRQILVVWPNKEGAAHAHLTEIHPINIVFTIACLLAAFYGTKLLVWLVAGRRYHKRGCTNSCLLCGYDLTNLNPIPNPKQ